MGRPKGPETRPVPLTLPKGLAERLRRARQVEATWSVNKVLNLAVQLWLEQIESQEDVFVTFDGYEIRKPAGKQYPQRQTDAQRKGAPRGDERTSDGEERWHTTFRLEVDLYERLENAIYWRETLRSQDVETAVRLWLDEVAGRRAL